MAKVEASGGGKVLSLPTEQTVEEGDADFGDFEPLIEAITGRLLEIDEELLMEYAGSRVTLEIDDEGVCIQAEDLE
jgi:hypothetical protein